MPMKDRPLVGMLGQAGYLPNLCDTKGNIGRRETIVHHVCVGLQADGDESK